MQERPEIINTTPHPITFKDEAGEWTVEPCGKIINAKISERKIATLPNNNITLVTPTFEPTDEGILTVIELMANNPSAIIVGSIIAAQAYKGQVFGMIAADGFERVPVDQKKMRSDKFTAFLKGDE